MTEDGWYPIAGDRDIVTARQHCRQMAGQLGFRSSDQVLVATAVSEIARNIVQYARAGKMTFRIVTHGSRHGLLVIASDDGPGISDVARAMQDGYSTSKGLGMGLPGTRRLMDEFEIVSEVGKGTKVTMTKWVP